MVFLRQVQGGRGANVFFRRSQITQRTRGSAVDSNIDRVVLHTIFPCGIVAALKPRRCSKLLWKNRGEQIKYLATRHITGQGQSNIDQPIRARRLVYSNVICVGCHPDVLPPPCRMMVFVVSFGLGQAGNGRLPSHGIRAFVLLSRSVPVSSQQ